MLDNEVRRIATNPGAIALYKQAIGLLEQSQVLYLLRCLGRPTRLTTSTDSYMVQEGAHSSGWQDCLDTLMNLEKIVLDPFKDKGTKLPDASYGALKLLLDRGDITEDEYRFRRGELTKEEYLARVKADREVIPLKK